MIVPKIYKWPNVALTVPTEEVKVPLSPELSAIAEVMKTALAGISDGIALAANQAGFSVRMFVVRPKDCERLGLPEVVINPTWSQMNDDANVKSEGCLSFPNLYIPIERWSHIDCSWDTLDGLHHHAILSDLPARVYQHECEHLSGETFLENLPRIQRFQLMAQIRKHGHRR